MKIYSAAGILALLVSCGGGSTPAPDDPKEQEAALHAQAAETALRARDYDQAIALASDALALSPEFPKAYLIRAKARHARKESPQEDFDRAVRAAPEESRAVYLFHRGLWHQDSGKLDLALADFDASCALQKRFPKEVYYVESFLERGRTLAMLGRPDEALRDYEFVLTITDDDGTRRRIAALKSELGRKKPGGVRDK